MSTAEPDEVIAVIAETLDPEPVSADSNFDDLGTDSVLMLRLMVALQGRFGVLLDVVDMFDVETVGDLVALVEQRQTDGGAPRADLASESH